MSNRAIAAQKLSERTDSFDFRGELFLPGLRLEFKSGRCFI